MIIVQNYNFSIIIDVLFYVTDKCTWKDFNYKNDNNQCVSDKWIWLEHLILLEGKLPWRFWKKDFKRQNYSSLKTKTTGTKAKAVDQFYLKNFCKSM